MKDDYIYKSCEIMRIINLSHLFPDNFGNTILFLKDYTANGQNLINPHPHYLKYYAKYPYWVQIKDEDDFILQKEFSFLTDAYKFFESFIDNPDKMIKEMY